MPSPENKDPVIFMADLVIPIGLFANSIAYALSGDAETGTKFLIGFLLVFPMKGLSRMAISSIAEIKLRGSYGVEFADFSYQLFLALNGTLSVVLLGQAAITIAETFINSS